MEGRAAQGDAAGWVMAAAGAAKLPVGRRGTSAGPVGRRLTTDAIRNRGALSTAGMPWSGPTLSAARLPWRGRADYQEKDEGEYLGNALASTFADELGARGAPGRLERRLVPAFETNRGLVRVAGEPDSGLDTAAAWAVRPFPVPALFPAVRRTLLRLVAERKSRFGLLPSQGWDGGEDPWTAPTAWSAWALAALAREQDKGTRGTKGAPRQADRAHDDRRAALALTADLRRAATPLGLLPERVDARTGLPASTTPLAWSHAFAILALRELWP